MDSGELIELFYNRTYEKFVNKQILDDKNYIVPRQQLTNYVHELIDIPYIEFIKYLKNQYENNIVLKSTDITHFSCFSACEIDMCNALIWANNPGCTFTEIGRLFPEKVPSRKDIAYRIYGEKHIKAATQLGLTFEYYDYWYLSCIGYIYPDLDHDDRMQLLARTITRNVLYHKMLIDIMDHDVYPELYLSMIYGITLKSRIKNVITFFEICLEECELNKINTHRLYRRNANIEFSASLSSRKEKSKYSSYYSYKILSTDEITSLFKQYRNGDRNAFDTLVKSYLKLVLSTARFFEGRGLEYDDLIQEGTLGLIRAIERYDYNQDTSFGYYAKTWIRQFILQAINSHSLTVKIPQNQLVLYKKVRKEIEDFEQKNEFNPSVTDIEIGEDVDLENLSYLNNLPDDLHELVYREDNWDDYPSIDFPADDIVMKESRLHIVKSMLSKLKHREAEILRRAYGIGVKVEDLSKIGEHMGLTRERIRQIKEKAIKILRDIAKSKITVKKVDIRKKNSINNEHDKRSVRKKEVFANNSNYKTLPTQNKGENIFQTSKTVHKAERRRQMEYNKKILSAPMPKEECNEENLIIGRLEKESSKKTEILYNYYTQRIIKLKQAIVNGERILAKPALLVAIIDGIECNQIQQNKIELSKNLENRYITILANYTKKSISERLTNISMPFWHLKSDGFWFLEPPCPNAKNFNPSKKWLLDNIQYARLDDDLWELLQDGSWRCKLRDFIIENKLLKQSVPQNNNVQLDEIDIYSRNENVLQQKFFTSTSLKNLVGLGVITKKQFKQCNKKGLKTIGDVKKKIEFYDLTPDSTRFTKYTLDMWFDIVGLLNNNV